ncbi:MAG TPA: ABC transporter permease [Opitutus sp.]|nr:ABC transporter permease [Opitutus sp.]
MFSDLRFAFRSLTKSPGFTAIAVLSLALGIGLNTSMFSLMNLLILKPLPYPDKVHLVKIYRTTAQDGSASHNAQSFLDLQRETASFVKVAAFRKWGYTLTQPGRTPVNLNALRVSAGFFPVLGLQPELGRLFTPEEDAPGNHVIILSHGTWAAQFGGDPAVIGKTVTIDGEGTTIVGVMPEKFSSVFLWGPGDVFRPLALTPQEKAATSDSQIQLIGRYDRAMTLPQLNSRLKTVAAQLAPTRIREQSEDSLRAAELESTTVPPGTGFGASFLLALSGFVLLIVCGNLANLQLARAISRSRELAIRSALGASHSHLLRPLFFEGVLLAVLGGTLGILVAEWGNEWLSKSLSENLPVNFEVSIDWRVLTFALGLSLLTGIVFGLVPAMQTSRVRVNDALKTSGRGATGDKSQHLLRNVLIVVQFAAALVLLSCTGFFIRGMRMMLARDVGWKTAGLTHCILNLPQTRYATPQQSYEFYQQLEQRLRAAPGVEGVAVAWTAPLYMYLQTRSFVVEGRPPPKPGLEPLANVNSVSPSFLDTLGMRLLSGRQFAPTDSATAPRVVLINDSFARSLFPDGGAVGHSLVSGSGSQRVTAQIVGVFADISLAGNPSPQKTPYLVFEPLAQETWNYSTVLVRSSQAGMTETLRHTVNSLDPTIPVTLLNSVTELAKTATRSMALISTIFIGFSALGLFLAALGLYGVIMRLVTLRTQEIGVRMALGAQLPDIMRLILGTGFRLALIGAGVGLLGSIGVNLLLGALFNNGSLRLDYTTLLLTTSVLVFVALVASYLPARRATHVNPVDALRAE